jgi:hypothetical protein
MKMHQSHRTDCSFSGAVYCFQRTAILILCQPRREPFTKEFFDGKKIRKIRLESISPTITSAIECGMQTRLLGVRAFREF